MRSTLKFVAVCSVVVVLSDLALVALSRARRPDPLLGVAWPIVIVELISWDDAGSKGLAFQDAWGVRRDACLMDDLEGNRNLILGSYAPVHDADELRRYPIGGADERRSTRLMEEWARGDPDARWWDERLSRYERGEVGLVKLAEDSPSGAFDHKAWRRLFRASSAGGIPPNLALQRTPPRRDARCAIVTLLGGASSLSLVVRRRDATAWTFSVDG